MFLGRKKELKNLNNKYVSEKKEFGVIYGRRRIGKSFLINEFLKNKKCIFFQAKKDTAYGNLKSFSYEVNKTFNFPSSYVFSSWEEVLDVIIEKSNGERFVLAIDEYPYIVSQSDSFPSIIQSFIDKAPDNIFLLLSGSDVSFLNNEILDHNSPLYKRITFEMEIKKMEFDEACLFLENLPIEEKISYLSLFGSYPYYLASINKSISFEENVYNLVFNEYGPFFNLPDQLLSNSTKTQDVYNSIMLSIAKKHKNIKSISEDIKEEQAKIAKYISTLLESELLEKLEMFMGNKKNNYYEIQDPLLKFWYLFIFPNKERIKINSEIIYKSLLEKIKLFISHEFEKVCHLYLEMLNKKGLLNDVYPKVKNYKVENSSLGRSIEIDGLSRIDNNLLIVDCKYRNAVYSIKMFNHLKESTSIFPKTLNKTYYIFSKLGFDDNIICDDNIKLITIQEMFNI